MNIKDKIKTIHASGTRVLTEKQKQLTNRLLNEYYKRIQRQLKNQTSIEFHVKNYEHADKQKKKMDNGVDTNPSIKSKRQKFSIHTRIDTPAKIFEADYADWELERAIHKTMNKLMNEIEHALHSSDQHDKMRKNQQKRKR